MPNIVDVASEYDGGEGKVSKIVNVFTDVNPILEDMEMMEGNLTTGNKSVILSGIPRGTWTKLNYGVQPSKVSSVAVTDTAGILENYSEVDKRLVELSGDVKGSRAKTDKAILQGLSLDMAETLFYGDTDTNPERFMGLSARYNDLSAPNGENIIDAGGSGVDNTSIWIVCWGENTAHGFFPKGSKAGVEAEDLGQVTLTDADGGLYEGYRSHFSWKVGFTLVNWKYVVRVANIDVSDLSKNMTTGADLSDILIQAVETLPDTNIGKPVIYANKTITTMLRRQINNKSNVMLNLTNYAGKEILTFDGIPVRKCDALSVNEAPVT